MSLVNTLIEYNYNNIIFYNPETEGQLFSYYKKVMDKLDKFKEETRVYQDFFKKKEKKHKKELEQLKGEIYSSSPENADELYKKAKKIKKKEFENRMKKERDEMLLNPKEKGVLIKEYVKQFPEEQQEIIYNYINQRMFSLYRYNRKVVMNKIRGLSSESELENKITNINEFKSKNKKVDAVYEKDYFKRLKKWIIKEGDKYLPVLINESKMDEEFLMDYMKTFNTLYLGDSKIDDKDIIDDNNRGEKIKQKLIKKKFKKVIKKENKRIKKFKRINKKLKNHNLEEREIEENKAIKFLDKIGRVELLKPKKLNKYYKKIRKAG